MSSDRVSRLSVVDRQPINRDSQSILNGNTLYKYIRMVLKKKERSGGGQIFTRFVCHSKIKFKIFSFASIIHVHRNNGGVFKTFRKKHPLAYIFERLGLLNVCRSYISFHSLSVIFDESFEYFEQ